MSGQCLVLPGDDSRALVANHWAAGVSYVVAIGVFVVFCLGAYVGAYACQWWLSARRFKYLGDARAQGAWVESDGTVGSSHHAHQFYVAAN